MNSFLKKYHYFLLILILGFAFFTRIIRVNEPSRYIFDEVYHALTAKLISRGDVRAFEWWNPTVEENTAVDWLHPPLAKYTQAFFINIFGENSFGWRVSSVIFGVLVILMTYKLAWELFENKNLSLLAAFLASLDGLLLTQSRIAMNDIHVTFFILTTLIIYLRYLKQKKPLLIILTGLSAGLAMGTKWSGLFALLIVLFFEGIHYLQTFFKESKNFYQKYIKNNNSQINFKKNISDINRVIQPQKILLLIVSLLIIPITVYVLSYSKMFLQGKSLFCDQKTSIVGRCYYETIKIGDWQWSGYISHFAELHHQIWWYQTNLKATHTYQSRPYQWFFNLRPVWMHVDYQGQSIGNTYAQGNTMLFWIGDIAIFMTVLIFILKALVRVIKIKQNKLIKEIKQLKLPKYLFFLLFAYFAVWLPWQLSPRIMFFYHYTPAVPLLSIILAYWLNSMINVKIKRYRIGKTILKLVLLLCLINFIVFYPNWTSIVLPKKLIEPIYFAIKSWK